MQLTAPRRFVLVWITTTVLVSSFILSVATAQGTRSATSAADQVRIVDVTQKGNPPSGPYPIVIEHDQSLATHTVYRPATLGPSKHPVVVWGEGACVKNGLSFPEFLSEIASYGFVVVADGPPVEQTARGGQARGGMRREAHSRRRLEALREVKRR